MHFLQNLVWQKSLNLFCLAIDLSWPTSVIKYLGVNIPLNKLYKLSLLEENSADIIHNLHSTLNLWLVRGLILSGKMTVLKTLVFPKLIHKASYILIHLPEKFVKQLNRVLFTFIWGSKWGKKLGDYNSAVVLRREEQK